MSQKLFHGTYQDDRISIKQRKRKTVLKIAVIVLIIVIIVLIALFMPDAQKQEEISNAIRENTELKLQIDEMQEQIDTLNTQIRELNGELEERPTPTPEAIEPPNESVGSSGNRNTSPEPENTYSPEPSQRPSRSSDRND